MSAIFKLPLILDPQPEGETSQEALENVSDALGALLEAYEYLKRPVPGVLKRAAIDHPLQFETLIAVP